MEVYLVDPYTQARGSYSVEIRRGDRLVAAANGQKSYEDALSVALQIVRNKRKAGEL